MNEYNIKPMRIILIRSLFIGILTAACGTYHGNPAGNDDGGTTVEEQKPCPASNLPDVSPMSAQMLVNLPNDIDDCSAYGYIVGYEGTLTLQRTEDDSFYLLNVPGGIHDIVILASDKTVDSASALNRGQRINNVEFLNGIRGTLDVPELPIMGRLSGRVTLQGAGDFAGTKAYIPGTSYQATTDAEGNYEIGPYLPVGVHQIYFEHEGYHRGQISMLDITSLETTAVPDIKLSLSTGAEGFIILQEGKDLHDSLTVSFIVGATFNAALMKVSERATFDNTSWEPLKTYQTYTFTSEGNKTLYVKFADSNGLESSPFSDTITVDLFSVEGSVITFEGNKQRYSSNEIFAEITAPKHADEVMISLSSEFEEANWEALISRVPIHFPASGDHTVFVKFRDFDKFESRVYSKSITIGHWKILDYPYERSRSSTIVWTGSRLLVWGGWDRSTNPNPSGVRDDGFLLDINSGEKTYMRVDKENSPGRSYNFSAWTGTELLVWGGGSASSPRPGAIYNLASDSWRQMATANAPIDQILPIGVWSGSHLIIWGGKDAEENAVNTGAKYELTSNTWTSLSITNAPEARAGHGAAWTGSKMFIWGGWNSNGIMENSGGLYDPLTDSWTTVSTTDAPLGSSRPAVLRIGSKIFVFGYHVVGTSPAISTEASGIYDPATDTWQRIAPLAIPDDAIFGSLGSEMSAIWTGHSVILYGGMSLLNRFGYEYHVDRNEWTRLSVDGAPAFGLYHAAVWTGEEMVLWGGEKSHASHTAIGAIYTP